VVFGSRFIGETPHRILYFWHTVANKMLTLASNVFSDLNLTDMETCYKVFKKDVLRQIVIEENRFGIEPEVTAKVAELVRTQGIRLFEVGISYNGRTYDEGKKIGWKDAIRAGWCILKYNTSGFAHLFKYGMNGLFVALSQFLVIIALVDGLGLKSLVEQSVANLVSIEASLLVGLVLHSFVTWRYRYETVLKFAKVFFLFHLVTGLSFAVRAVLFPALAYAVHLDYLTNTLVGIVTAVFINFVGYDRLVFKKKADEIIYKRHK